jgi:hypothetical protein
MMLHRTSLLPVLVFVAFCFARGFQPSWKPAAAVARRMTTELTAAKQKNTKQQGSGSSSNNDKKSVADTLRKLFNDNFLFGKPEYDWTTGKPVDKDNSWQSKTKVNWLIKAETNKSPTTTKKKGKN